MNGRFSCYASKSIIGIDKTIRINIDAEFQNRMTLESPQIPGADEYSWCSALLKDGTCLASLRCLQRAVKARGLWRGLTFVVWNICVEWRSERRAKFNCKTLRSINYFLSLKQVFYSNGTNKKIEHTSFIICSEIHI